LNLLFIVLAIALHHCFTLEFADKKIITPEIIMKTIRQNGLAIRYIKQKNADNKNSIGSSETRWTSSPICKK
jgi:hypothetical protein